MTDQTPVHIPRDRYPEPIYPEALFSPSTEHAGNETHLLDYWRVIVTRRWSIIAIMVTVITAILIVTFNQTPIYRATSTIQIDKENQNILSFKGVYEGESSTDDSLRTQFEVLRSRSLARRVIEDLKLDRLEEFQVQDPGAASLFFQGIRDMILPASAEQKDADPLRPVIEEYLERLEVARVRLARLAYVSFESKDPRLAARIIDAHAKHFIEQNLQFKFDATNEASKFLEQNLVTLQSTLEKSEDHLQEYSRENGILFTELGRNTTTEKLQQLETEHTKALADRFQKQSYEQLIASGTDALPQLLFSPALGDLVAKLIDLKRQEADLATTFAAEYPALKRLRSQIAELEASRKSEGALIVSTVKSEYASAVEREKLLSDQLEQQRELVTQTNQEIIQYNILKRQVESDRQLYDGLLTRLKEAGVSAGLKASNIRVVDRAEVPPWPVRPRKAVNLLLSIMVGLVLGVGFAFTQDYLDNSLKAPEDVSRYLNLATLGLIPKLESLVGKVGYGYGGDYGKPYGHLPVGDGDSLSSEKVLGVDLIAHTAPTSLMAEAYRSVRTSLLLASPGQPARTILVTSATPSEGKTVTAANLAISLTQTGSKVLLIDVDMRKPRVQAVFSLGNTIGLSAVLAGTCTLREAIQETVVPNLLVLPCGATPPNPGELILSTGFRHMIQALREHFDYVVLDSPPVSSVSDSRIIASIADTCILVVKAFATPRHQVRHAVDSLRTARARMAGVVLNDVDVRIRSYYSGNSYYRTSYGGYGTYGGNPPPQPSK